MELILLHGNKDAMNWLVPLVLIPASHDDAFALLSPRIALLVGGVNEGIRLLVLLNVLSHPEDM